MKFGDKHIEEFLYTPGKYFEIPVFQRPYSWRVNNVDEFLADLEYCVNTGKPHFFGAVVYVEDADDIDSSVIIDGQQRITTALLMVTAIYHLVNKNSDLVEQQEDPTKTLTASRIKEKYLVNSNDTSRIKLRTVTTDNLILQKIFAASDGADEDLSTDERQSYLYQAYAKFKDYFTDRNNLDRYIKGLQHFQVSTVKLTPGEDNPQRAFESINSTGKPLSDGDKIRNFALMLNSTKLRDEVYEKYWKKIEQTLTVVTKEYITDFFRSYVIHKNQKIIKFDAVYPEFKKLFRSQIGEEQNPETVHAFYSDIVKVLDYYRALKFGISETQYSVTVRDVAFKMRYIQTDLYIPFAISVLHYCLGGNMSPGEVDEVFKLIEIYFSRRLICNIMATSVDRFLSTLHSDILTYLQEDETASYVEVMKHILLKRSGQTRLPSDDEFKSSIYDQPIYNQRSSRVVYVLTAFDDRSRESNTLKQIVSKDLTLSVEHVMPQSLSNKKWRTDLGEDALGVERVQEIHDHYLDTLSNLTLTAYNSEYSNLPFIDEANPKKAKMTLVDKSGNEVGFKYSPLAINKWIAERSVWDEGTMKERQDWWFKSLDRVWPLPVSVFEPKKHLETLSLLTKRDLKGKVIRSVQVLGYQTAVSSWAEALDTIVETLYELDVQTFEKVLVDPWLSSYIKTENNEFISSMEIFETGYYVETNNDTNTKLRIIHALGEFFGLDSDDILAEVAE